MNSKQEKKTISPSYVLCLFLSVPAGLIAAYLTGFDSLPFRFLIGMIPAAIVITAAYFQTRS